MNERRNVSPALYVVLTVVCVLLACAVLNGTAFATEFPTDLEVPESNSEETVLQTEISSGEADMENVNAAVENRIVFEPMELDQVGTSGLADIYNALVNIYNLCLLSYITFLIIWTYNMITKSFRRFIY